MKQVILACLVIGAMTAATAVQADDSDDTLRFYLSKSDLVISGSITSEPIGLSSESGVVGYGCDFTVVDVLAGDVSVKGKTIKVTIGRFESDAKDKHPLVKKGSECILFLKGQGTTDYWFGIQQLSPSMVKSLKRLAKEK